MIAEVWSKALPVIVELEGQDQACEVEPLPLYLSLRLNHYLGFYAQTIRDFFFRYALQPFNQEEFWLEYRDADGKSHQLRPTEIVCNLYMKYWQALSDIPTIVAHFRSKQADPAIDLLDFYRQNLKASTCLKFRKQGVGILFSSFSHDQLNNLLVNLRASSYQAFYGTDSEELGPVGFKILMKFDIVPVRFFVGSEKVERTCDPNSSVRELVRNTFGDIDRQVFLWGVPIPLQTRVADICELCHADGFLYLFIHQ